MRVINPIVIAGYTAKVAMDANLIVIQDAANAKGCDLPGGDNAAVLLGVTMEKAAAGAQVDVCLFGFWDVVVDSTTDIAIGDAIISKGTAGKGMKFTTTNNLTVNVLGYSMEVATDNDLGNLISVFINPGARVINAA